MKQRAQWKHRFLCAVALAAWPALAACGGITEKEPSVDVGTIDHELQLGDRGREVEAVYSRLSAIGYFPNEELAAYDPRWISVTDTAPLDPSFFGPELESAVRAYQERSGLEVTGRVDRDVLTLLATRTCGVPDSLEAAAGEKWDIGTRITGNTVRYRTTAYTADFGAGSAGQTAADNALAGGFNTWAAPVTNLTFTRVTDNSWDVEIKWYTNNNGPTGWPNLTGFNGFATPHPTVSGKWALALNDAVNWTTNQTNITSSHEMGHVIGMPHSGFNTAMMFPSGNGTANLGADDRAGVGVLYNTWRGVAGFAVDIGTGGTSGNPQVWVTSGSDTIWKYNWSTSQFDQTFGAARNITVTNTGVPWVADASNVIWEGEPTGVFWTQRGSGRDVGAGGGKVFAVSNTASAGGNFVINRWDTSPAPAHWTATTGIGVRVAADETGRPWVVQANGLIWRLNGSTWENLPGLATDIAAGGGSVWVTSLTANGSNGDFDTFIWNEQPASTIGTPLAVQRFRWLGVPGFGRRLAVAFDGRPWVVQAQGPIFRRNHIP